MSRYPGGKALTCTVQNDFPTTVVRPRGPLTYGTVPVLRHAVLKAFAEQPELLLVDVSGLEAVDDVTLTSLLALAGHGELAEVTVMLYGPSPDLANRLRAMSVSSAVPTFRTEEQAKSAYALSPAPRRVRMELQPVPGATAEARCLIDDACGRWRVGGLADTAALIATELVANAIQHARTPIVFSVALRRTYLHIGVRDRSGDPPVRGGAGSRDGDGDVEDTGRGLLIVESLAAGWGHARTQDGKVVWATVRLPKQSAKPD